MKCLLCVISFIEEELLKRHYVSFHEINSENFFCQTLFEKKKENNFNLRKVLGVTPLSLVKKEERRNNCLQHLQQDGAIPVENLPVIREGSGTIIRFSIDHETHRNYYNFENPSRLIQNFFSVVDIKFETNGAQEYIIKPSFCIRNYQPPPEGINNAVALYDKRVWSTETYNGRFLMMI